MPDKSNFAALAELAYLDVDHHPELAQEIDDIMDFIDELRAVKTQGTQPLFHPFDLQQRFRADNITAPDCRQQLSEMAPAFEDDLYAVPKIIET